MCYNRGKTDGGGDALGEKDISQREFAEYEDTFADIVNVLLLKGKRLILPDELKEATVKSSYKDKKFRLRMQERDVAKFWERCNIIIAMIGLENQVSIHRAMPVRIIGYDGATYRDQLNKTEPDDELGAGNEQKVLSIYPVINIVLHFDYKRRWTAPRTLKECFENVPPELDPYINDYKINLFEVAWLPDETIAQFQSDFRFVADYYSQMRKTGKWQPMPGKVAHMKELFDMFNTLTGDKRFIEMYANRKGDVDDMSCVALDYLAAEYADKMRDTVRNEGRNEGIDAAREKSALNMFADKLPIDKIVQYSDLSLQAATELGRKHGYIQ